MTVRRSLAVGDVVIDRLGKGVRFLKDHADLGVQLDRVYPGNVDVLAIERYVVRDPADINRVIHPVQDAQEGRLAAAGRSDERCEVLS